jgi:YD repeat-containing protein
VAIIKNAHAKQVNFENFEASFPPFPHSINGNPVIDYTWQRSLVTGWEWVSTNGNITLNPALSPLAHTGSFSLQPPDIVWYDTPQQRPATGGTAARPNVTVCQPLGGTAGGSGTGSGPIPVTDIVGTMMANYTYADPFWCLQAAISHTPTHSEEYVLSFWARLAPGTAPSANTFVGAWVDVCNRRPVAMLVSDERWQHFQLPYRVDDSHGAEDWLVWLGGNGVLLDDIRLAPRDARVSTYTHRPHVGVTSTIDDNNRTSYFEYDDFGRLRATYDEDGNLLQAHDYHLSQP